MIALWGGTLLKTRNNTVVVSPGLVLRVTADILLHPSILPSNIEVRRGHSYRSHDCKATQKLDEDGYQILITEYFIKYTAVCEKCIHILNPIELHLELNMVLNLQPNLELNLNLNMETEKLLQPNGCNKGTLSLCCQMVSSIKDYCPSEVVFHKRLSFIKGRLASKIILHQSFYPIKGCLPLNVIFHQSLSLVENSLWWCDNLFWKITFDGRQLLLEDNLLWKTTLLLEDNFGWKTNCNGIHPSPS